MMADQTQSRRASKVAIAALALVTAVMSGCDVWGAAPDSRHGLPPAGVAPPPPTPPRPCSPQPPAPPAADRTWNPPEAANTYRAPADAWQDKVPVLPSAE